jgi:hypothetical protein
MDIFEDFPEVAAAVFNALKIHEERGALNFCVGGEEYAWLRSDVVVSCSQFEEDVGAPLVGCAMKVDPFNSVPVLEPSDSVWGASKLLGAELRNKCVPGLGCDPLFSAYDKERCNVPARHVMTSYTATVLEEYKQCSAFRDPPAWARSLVDAKVGPLVISTHHADRYKSFNFPVVEPSCSDLVLSSNLYPHKRAVFFSPAYAAYHAQAQIALLPDRIQLSYVWKGSLKHRFLSRDPNIKYVISHLGPDTLVSLGSSGEDCESLDSASDVDSDSADEASNKTDDPGGEDRAQRVKDPPYELVYQDNLPESHTDYFFCVHNSPGNIVPPFCVRVEEQRRPYQFFQHRQPLRIFSGVLGRFSSRFCAATVMGHGIYVVVDAPMPEIIECSEYGEELYVLGNVVHFGRTFAYRVISHARVEATGRFALSLEFIAGYALAHTRIRSLSTPDGDEPLDMWEKDAPPEELCVLRW